MSQRIYLSPPHMNGQEMRYIDKAFSTNWIAPLGENVTEFEEKVKKYTDMPYALAVNSGTSAIHLALKSLDVHEGDCVYCSDVTFIGTINPIIYQGAEPVFIDCDRQSWCMDPALLLKALEDGKKNNRLPKAVLVVDLYGLPANYSEILNISSQFGVPVIEDAAEALGTTYKGAKCGSFGELAVFSFNGNKIITTSGGGMVLSRDKDRITKMLYWATQARENLPYYEHNEIGYNYRLSNICAGIGCGQMDGIDNFVNARRKIYDKYVSALSDLPVSFYPELKDCRPNCWLTVMKLESGCGHSVTELINALAAKSIESRPVWKPMHTQPVFRNLSSYSADNQHYVGDELFATALCLPSGSAISEPEQSIVIETIRAILSK